MNRTDELFQPAEVAMDSPKLAWKKRHGIIGFHHLSKHCPPTYFVGFQKWWPELRGIEFFAQETAENGDSRCVEANTEEEALAEFARQYRIPLWNEEVSS